MITRLYILGFTLIALSGCAQFLEALRGVPADAAKAAGDAAADPSSLIWPYGTLTAAGGVLVYVFRGFISRLAVASYNKVRGV
jgi:hypothetical protein